MKHIEHTTPEDAALADRISGWMGTGLMVMASTLAVLIFADRTDADLFPMPRMWHDTRNLHILLCVILFVLAAALLKSRSTSDADLQPRPLFRTVRFFTRGGCHLCDDAMEVLLRYQMWLPPVDIIDVDRDSTLKRQFGESVPVVEIDGRVRFRGGVSQGLLQRLIEGQALYLETQQFEPQGGAITKPGVAAEGAHPRKAPPNCD